MQDTEPGSRSVKAAGLAAPIGVLVALEREASAVRSGLRLGATATDRGDEAVMISGVPVVLLCGGPGRRGAERGVEALCTNHGATLVVSLGLAGGLRPGLAAGDVVAVAQTRLASARTSQRTTPELVALARRSAPRGLRTGGAVTVIRPLGLPAAKHSLGAACDAAVVDMESYWVATAGLRAGVRVLILRAVSDPVDQPLPEWLGAMNDSGRMRWSALVRTGLAHPGDLRHLPALWRGARRAEVALVETVAALLPGLAEAAA